jgi:hypothetical protein
MSPTLLMTAAYAAVPEEVLPIVAEAGAPDQYAAWRAANGLAPAGPVCRDTWPGVLVVCARVEDGGRRRWVSSEDLVSWGVSAAEVWSALEARAATRVAGSERVRPVTGMAGANYWAEAEADGWAAAVLLAPDAVARRLGGTSLRVAAPTPDVVLAWVDGGAEVDQIVSVGAAELAATSAGLTPQVWVWRGGWVPGFVARARSSP